MNHFWKIIILLLTFGLVITGCKKDEKAPEKSEFTDADIETLYREIESQADAILMSDTPDWSALVEKYKDRKEIAAIEANSDGMMVEFVNERVNGWLIPPPPLTIKWDTEKLRNIKNSKQSAVEKPKMLIVNTLYHENRQDVNFCLPELNTAFENVWDVTIVDEQANVDFFGKGLKGYDVVVIYAHGVTLNNKTWIQTSEEKQSNTIEKGIAAIKVLLGKEIVKEYLNVSNLDISNNYSEKSFENSMIYMACCQGLKYPTHLGKAFVDKGAKVVVGWDETTCIGIYSGYCLLEYMLNNNCSLNDGWNYLKTEPLTLADEDGTWMEYQSLAADIGIHGNGNHNAHLVFYGRTGNDIGLNKGGDYKLPASTPDEIMINEDFSSPNALDNWIISKIVGGGGSTGNGKAEIANGNLVISTEGGNDGFMGKPDGIYLTPNYGGAVSSFKNVKYEISIQENYITAINGYKERLGFHLTFRNKNNNNRIVVGFDGKYFGYSPIDGAYNVYNKHTFSIWQAENNGIELNTISFYSIVDLDLEKYYTYEFSISQKNGLWLLKYQDKNSSVENSMDITEFFGNDNDSEFIPEIMISSYDGGYTRQNGQGSASIDYFRVSKIE